MNERGRCWRVFLLAVLLLLLAPPLQAAVFQVTRSDDAAVPDGCQPFDCTLREAVLAANALAGKDRIEIPLIEISLQRDGRDDVGLFGDLDVLDDLVVAGQFVTLVPLMITAIDGAGFDDRVFDVHNGVSLRLENLLIHNADLQTGDGGGVRARNATLDLLNVHFIGNRARNGAGIYAQDSAVYMAYGQFAINFAEIGDGGGVAGIGGSGWFSHARFSENQASGAGGAISWRQFDNPEGENALLLQSLDVSGNSAERGGGLALDSGASVVNPARHSVHIDGGDWRGNEAASGGAIHHVNARLQLSDVTLRDNLAFDPDGGARGGAVYSGDVLAADGRTELLLFNSLLYNNTAADDGGALALFDRADLSNTTVSGNTAPQGGAVWAVGAELTWVHATIAHNQSSAGVDVFVGLNASVTSLNSVLLASCGVVGGAPTLSLGGNIESPGNACGFGAGANDRTAVAAVGLLDAILQDNGGPTLTHRIDDWSSAALNNALPWPDTPLDQRHLPRDAAPDSGAYEVQPGEIDVIFLHGFET